jgi:APA family basic amino acid/polyamine antiporter
MSRDGLFFKRVGSVNSHHVPAVALIAQGLWASFLVLPRTVTINQQTGGYSLETFTRNYWNTSFPRI